MVTDTVDADIVFVVIDDFGKPGKQGLENFFSSMDYVNRVLQRLPDLAGRSKYPLKPFGVGDVVAQ
ncbi:MAG: hypothetical protein WC997_09350 [Porticoccaceae bacterium]